MRIISGTAGGIPIRVPSSLTRPTTDRVRESLFSILGNGVVEARILDLYAGSGSLGLECLSRGASHVTFVDDSREALDCIRKNLDKAKLTDQADLRKDRVARFLERNTRFHDQIDWIFADPPYIRDEDTETALIEFLNNENLPPFLKDEGFLILETWARRPVPETPLWKLEREKDFGDTRLSFFSPIR